MIASLGGAAYVAERSGSLGGTADKHLFATLRTLADVILLGAATMRVESYGPARGRGARAARREAGLGPVSPIAVVTRTCHLEWHSPFFTEAERCPIVISAASAPATDRAAAGEWLKLLSSATMASTSIARCAVWANWARTPQDGDITRHSMATATSVHPRNKPPRGSETLVKLGVPPYGAPSYSIGRKKSSQPLSREASQQLKAK
jgi:hypothetical protein